MPPQIRFSSFSVAILVKPSGRVVDQARGAKLASGPSLSQLQTASTGLRCVAMF